MAMVFGYKHLCTYVYGCHFAIESEQKLLE